MLLGALLLVAVHGASCMAVRISSSSTALSEPLKAYADLKLGKPLERYAELLRNDDDVTARLLEMKSLTN